MKIDLILAAFFVLLVFSCGCISQEQPTLPVKSQPTPEISHSIQGSRDISVPVIEKPVISPELAYYQKGLDLYKKGEYAGAIEAFNATISLNQTNGNAYLARGKAFYQIGRILFYEARGDEELDSAISDFNQALALGADANEILTLRGWTYNWKGEINIRQHADGKYAKAGFPLLELAGADFSQVINNNPDNVDALNGRAVAYSRIGHGSWDLEYQYDNQKLDIAKKDAQRANNLDPTNPWTSYALWVTGGTSIVPAYKELDRAIQYDPEEAWFYFNRGQQKSKLDDDEGYFQDITTAIELQPRFVIAYNQLAKYYITQKQYDMALVTAQKALEINPNLGSSWNTFATAQFYYLNPITSAGLNECIKSADRAIAMDPESPLYHESKWIYLANAGRWDEAREEVRVIKILAVTNENEQRAQYMEIQTDLQRYNSNLVRY